MKPSIFILLFLVFIGYNKSLAQKQGAEILSYAEQMPEFIAGTDSLNRFIYSHLQYPEQAINQDIQGKVSVKFIVDAQGNVNNLNIVKKVDPMLDSEALRIVQLTNGLWKPGKQNGKNVSVYNVLAVNFKIIVDTIQAKQEQEVVKKVDTNDFKMPLYNGKYYENDMLRHIYNNLTFSKQEFENLFLAEIKFSCIIDTNGKCDHFKIIKSVNPDFDKEFLRVLRLMKKGWTPAMKGGKPINYKLVYNLSISNIYAKNISKKDEQKYYFVKGKSLISKNNINHALDYFVKAYSLDTTSTESLFYIAYCVIMQGKIQDACKLIESLKKRNHPKAEYLEQKYCAKKPEEIK